MARCNSSKKLLMIYDMPFPFVKGGGQRRFYEIGSCLAEDGWSVDWISFKAWNGKAVLNTENIKYIGIRNLPNVYNKEGNRRLYPPVLFAVSLMKYIKVLKNYDVIWAGQWPLLHLVPTIVLSKLNNKKLVIDWWEVWGKRIWVNYSRIVGYFGYILEKMLIRYATRFCTVFTDSLLEKRKLMKNSFHDSNVQFVPDGISRKEIGDVSFPKKPKYDIVSFGRLKNHKRVDLLIKATKNIIEDINIRYSVAIIGDGPKKDELMDLTNKLGLGDQITFFGTIPESKDMYSLIKQCSLCCITTQGGGGGNLAILEANACGLPVIVFDHNDGIDNDLIKSNVNGILVNPPDSDQLGLEIRNLLSDRDKLWGMKKSSYIHAIKYDWSQLYLGYKKFFQ